jgi:hypothetical protein
VKIECWLLYMRLATALVFSFLPLSSEDLLAASRENRSRTQAEWKALFDKESHGNFKGDFPEIKRLKAYVFFATTLCQGTELLAAYSFTEGSGRKKTLEELDQARICSREAVAALKPKLEKVKLEIGKRPGVSDKLKGYVATFISAMNRIPRAELSTAALERMQKQDKRLIQDKEGDLDAELLY